MSDFSIDLEKLKKTNKDSDDNALQKIDNVAEQHGFVDRTPKQKRGRPRSPRTGQVHAKVLPHISEQIAHESKRRGIQQGILIEEAWALYLNQHKDRS